MMTKTVLLLSGGIDSTTCLYDLYKSKNEITHCLLFDYKQRHAQELLWAKQHARYLGVSFQTETLPELGGLTEQSWIVPNRNGCLLFVAANVAATRGYNQVCIAVNKDDAEVFPDCRQGFFDAMNMALSASGYDIKIITPYINHTKRMVVDRAKQLGVDLAQTWSCYQPTSSGPCGKCLACQKREEAICGQ